MTWHFATIVNLEVAIKICLVCCSSVEILGFEAISFYLFVVVVVQVHAALLLKTIEMLLHRPSLLNV